MKKSIFLYLLTIGLIIGFISCEENRSKSDSSEINNQQKTTVNFWSGNRSEARQVYERQMLNAILKATEKDFGAWEITEHDEEYPGMEEALVFSEKGHDLFVTISGNQKFGKDDMIEVSHPLTKNLLGYRIPIIRKEDSVLFTNISDVDDVQKLSHGIPETWSDAVIFRQNGYEVVETGTFDDIFERLESGQFAYSAYGANEVSGVYKNRASETGELMIDDNVLFFYQFPLVFYVHPNRENLAERIEQGFQKVQSTGVFDSLFSKHYGNIVEQLNLDKRTVFTLENPLIPEKFKDLKPQLSKTIR